MNIDMSDPRTYDALDSMANLATNTMRSMKPGWKWVWCGCHYLDDQDVVEFRVQVRNELDLLKGLNVTTDRQWFKLFSQQHKQIFPFIETLVDRLQQMYAAPLTKGKFDYLTREEASCSIQYERISGIDWSPRLES